MKVIVCFDSVRVIVPCGDGEILVRELINKAIHRYKKATGKAGSHWVNVHNLKTISGGGILDPDDQLQDVCDDREQLIADFEEEGRPLHHNGGDGASASSTGTTSPDIFQMGEGVASSGDGGESATGDPGEEAGREEQEQGPGPPTPTRGGIGVITSPTFPIIPRQLQNGKTDIIVTAIDLNIGSSLRVRRGSEPALSTLGDEAIQKPLIPISNGLIASLHRRESVRESDEPRSESSDEEGQTGGGAIDKRKKSHLSKFSRDAFRTSLSNRPNMFVWMEAQERAEVKTKQQQAVQEERKGPVGASVSENDTKPKKQDTSSTDCILICLKNDGGPLGIHVVPASDDNGRDMGLMIQSLEPGGRIHKDGRLSAEDRIVEINGADLASVTFTRAQEIFRSAMKTDEICLKVIKRKPPKPAARTKGHPPTVMPKPRHAPAKPSPLTLPQKAPDGASPPTSPEKTSTPAQKEASAIIAPVATNGGSTLKSFYVSSTPKSTSTTPKSSSDLKSNSSSSSINGSEIPGSSTSAVVPKRTQPVKPGPPIRPSSPTKKTPPAVPVRHPTTSLTSQLKERPINALTNTRKIGKKIKIDLKKGPLGLGFSVTSRDNNTGGDVPIYIKNVLPKGAAIQDGRLKPGDRLLEVNGIPMAGKTQTEVVTMLRNTPQGSVVSLLVSRQEEVDERFTVPREMAQEKQQQQQQQQQQQEDSNTSASLNAQDENSDRKDDREDAQTCLQLSDQAGEELAVSEKFPMEVIRLEIPLNDTGSAGLGVSVKGKTLTTEAGPKDLGIFVKAVMHGGAASKDGRLMLNDQLLEVNGVNLRGIPNVNAMESLRRAMTTEGPSKGHIQLTVIRRVGAPSSYISSGHSLDSSQGESIMKHYRTQSDLSQQSDYVDSPYHSRQNSSSKMSDSDVFSGERTPSLASSLEKVSNGHSLVPGSGLRNESYMRATNDSLNDSSAFREAGSSPGAFKTVEKSRNKLTAPTVNTVNSSPPEEIIIEEDTYAQPVKPHLRQRPHSTIGFSHMGSSGEGDDMEDRQEPMSPADESDFSPVGDAAMTFQREGFGRQSMSEKRKGHVDPRTLEIYQRAKATKDHKEKGMESNPTEPAGTSASASLAHSGSMEALLSTSTVPAPTSTNTSMQHDDQFSMYRPPAPKVREISHTNLKRSSSLEDLSQPEPQPEQKPRDEAENQVPVWQAGRLGRVRACNESFRAAVDRSYDPVDPGLMDTLEEESMESGSFSVGQRSTSGRSSFSSENAGDDSYNSLKNKNKKAKEKKSGGGGLFKGFLRLGKGRKSAEDIGHSQGRSRSRSEERPSHLAVNRDPDAMEHVRKFAQQDIEENQIQEQYRRIQEQQQRQLQHQQQLQQQLHQQQHQQQRIASSSSVQSDLSSHSHPHSTGHTESTSQPYQQDLRSQFPPMGRTTGVGHSGARGGGGEVSLAGQAVSRAERIQQLRMAHQQQHRSRQGVYPLDQEEELYEQQMMENERRQHIMVAEVHHDIRGRHEMWQEHGETSGNYGQQFSRSSSQQSDHFGNSPYPSVSSMGSDVGNYTHHGGHLFPPAHTTLTGYDPHHHFHHHHHDVYDQQYEAQYGHGSGSGGGGGGGGETYMDQQRVYYDEAVRGFRDPPHRTGYSSGQRPVQRFADPGSAKV